MCTTILFGKNATIDGSTIIGRNCDTFKPYDPMRFYVRQANDNQNEILASTQNAFKMQLPKKAFRCQLTPQVEWEKKGLFSESGFNEKNVGMSATESFYANKRVLAYDPLIKDGIAEDVITDLILPYISSAKEGVEYLGSLIKKYGSPEGNGVIFSDKDDIWYMEILTGHHWIAQRIPDDSCCVIANQLSIAEVDFNDTKNFMWSEGLIEFVDKYKLNTCLKGWNNRKIFGTNSEKDRHYNTSRVWFGQKYFDPSIVQSPISSDLPFIFHANRKLSVDDARYILSSHYNETEFDPYGKLGSEQSKHMFRSIALNRTQNSHVMQIRNNVPSDISTIMWLCLGLPAYSPYIAFYGNSTDTHPSFNNTKLAWNMDDAYWMYRTVAALVEGHHSKLIQSDTDYLIDCHGEEIKMIYDIDSKAKNLKGEDLTAFLTESNYKIVEAMKEKTIKYLQDLIMLALDESELKFVMDKNL